MKEECKDLKFYFCRHCGKIIAIVKDSGIDTICCGEKMEELIPGTEDGSKEKHVPVIIRHGTCAIVSVGTDPHPMTEGHYIEWILLHTNKGFQHKCLKPGEKARAVFCLLPGEEVISAYEFCNVHKLWKWAVDRSQYPMQVCE